MMELIYSNKKDQKICEDSRYAIRKIGALPARNLAMLMGAIMSSTDLSDIAVMPQFRLHQLKGDKKDRYSFSIDRQIRVEFYPLDEHRNILKSGTNEKEMYKKTRYIQITGITNHYE